MLEPEQREVLESALSAGFDVTDLCREIFYRFKAKYRFDNEQTEQQISKSADELVRGLEVADLLHARDNLARHRGGQLHSAKALL
jgi:hypothetical protein